MTYRNRLLIGLAAIALGTASAAGATTGEARLMRYPDISGQRIGFIYADRLWVADANGDNARSIAVPGSELNRVRFSPDGQ